MVNTKVTISIDKETLRKVDKECNIEDRTRSNMIRIMIKAYHEVHKNNY